MESEQENPEDAKDNGHRGESGSNKPRYTTAIKIQDGQKKEKDLVGKHKLDSAVLKTTPQNSDKKANNSARSEENQSDNKGISSSQEPPTKGETNPGKAGEKMEAEDISTLEDLNAKFPPSPAKSERLHKCRTKHSPWQWSSIAGDFHFSYRFSQHQTVAEIENDIPFDRSPSITMTDFDKPLPPQKKKLADSDFKCSCCNTGRVKNKGMVCKICKFHNTDNRIKSSQSPPKYNAQTEEFCSNPLSLEEWETNGKKQYQNRINNMLGPILEERRKEMRHTKKQKKKMWGDLSSDEEENESHGTNEEGPNKGKGTKFNICIMPSNANEPCQTRSGRTRDYKDEAEREKWIEGIKLIRVKHYDQRHNTTWLQWEVAPGTSISRKKKKRLEAIAIRSKNPHV